MEKRALLAIALSAAVFMFYIYFVAPKPPEPNQQAAPQATQEKTGQQQAAPKPAVQGKAGSTAPEVKAAPATQAKPVNKAASIVPKMVEVSNGLVKYRFSEAGGRLVSARLANYLEKLGKNAPHKELVAVPNPWQAPLEVGLVKTRLAGLQNAFYTLTTPEGKFSAVDKPVRVSFSWTAPDGMEIIKTYTVQPKSYLMEAKVELVNRTGRNLDDNLTFSLTALHQPDEGGSYAFKGFGAYVDKSLTEESVKDMGKEPKVVSGKVSWGGYENSYFLQALLPLKEEGSIKGSLLNEAKDKVVVQAKYTSPPFSLANDQAADFEFKVFTGPKDIYLLNDLGYNLAASMNMGWFDIVAKPFLYFLKFVDGIVGNFGVAIIILTIIVKLLFWPLMTRSYKSMKRMQSLQPQMTKLREKYKDDKQRLNQEMMGLYKSNKVNPMGGCLPMVVQIPVFIALYRLLDYAIELRHAPFIFWIHDLSAPDRLFRFPFHVPFMDPPYGIPVLTLLMGVSMFIQQKMTPTPGDPTQAKVMLLMPVIFTFIFINFPAGLVLYWLVQNLWSIGQQTYINRKA